MSYSSVKPPDNFYHSFFSLHPGNGRDCVPGHLRLSLTIHWEIICSSSVRKILDTLIVHQCALTSFSVMLLCQPDTRHLTIFQRC